MSADNYVACPMCLKQLKDQIANIPNLPAGTQAMVGSSLKRALKDLEEADVGSEGPVIALYAELSFDGYKAKYEASGQCPDCGFDVSIGHEWDLTPKAE